MKHPPSVHRLRALLDYDQLTGVLTWRVSRGGGSPPAGSPAGRVNGTTGYRMIKLDGQLYSAHRLAWLHVHGEWPSSHIDHKDCEKDNNRIENLRVATRSQNNANSRRRSDNTSGLKGASFHRHSGKWRATIKGVDRYVHLGLFLTAEEAHAAYVSAARAHFNEYARPA